MRLDRRCGAVGGTCRRRGNGRRRRCGEVGFSAVHRPLSPYDGTALYRESLDQLLDGDPLAALLDSEARDRLVRAWHVLPAWPDAAEGISRLRKRYTVAAFSNGGLALLTRLVRAAELPFDCLLSAELARTYKPGLQAYRRAADLLDIAPDRVLMVAAHGWDLEGARQSRIPHRFRRASRYQPRPRPR
ncbi:HAD-IA family hydrolase [Nocardia tengchongensis]